MNWINIRDNLVVAMGVFLWSSGLPLIDHLLGKWDFMSLATARSLIAGLFLFVISSYKSRSIPDKQLVKKASLIGLTTYGFSGVCMVVGISYSDPVTASILVTLIPVISAFMDLFTTKRSILWKLMLTLV